MSDGVPMKRLNYLDIDNLARRSYQGEGVEVFKLSLSPSDEPICYDVNSAFQKPQPHSVLEQLGEWKDENQVEFPDYITDPIAENRRALNKMLECAVFLDDRARKKEDF